MWAEPVPRPGCGGEQEPGLAVWAQSGGCGGRARLWRKWFVKEMRCEHSALPYRVWLPASTAVGKRGLLPRAPGLAQELQDSAVVWQLLWAPGPAQPPATAHHRALSSAGAATAGEQPHLCHAGSVLPCAKSSPPGHPSEPSPWHSWQQWLAKAPAQNQPSPSFVPFY